MTAPGRCRACGGAVRSAGTATVTVALARCGVTVEVTAPACRCLACGGAEVAPEDLRRAHLLAARQLADHGVRTGEALRHMRKAVALHACALARLLGVTPETVSHWETGRGEVPCAVFAAVAALVEDALSGRTATHDRLERLASGVPFPRALTLDTR